MSHQLETETIALIEKNVISDAEFNRHALKLFRAQFDGIPAYKKLCEGRRKTPDDVSSYAEIPAVPTDVFKHVSLFWGEEKKRTFKTSGTTQGRRGEHHFGSLEIYNASMKAPFQKHVLKSKTLPFLVLAPSADALRDSSLSYMLSRMGDIFSKSISHFVGTDANNALIMQFEKFAQTLSSTNEPVVILGTAFALIGFFDAFPDTKWALPEGSVVMETGGLKGRTREVSRASFYEMVSDQLGIAKTNIVSEYSMTELSSQSYTNAFSETIPWEEAVYQTPPWARVDLVDPKTMKVDNTLNRGLIRWFDLANVFSVSAILTSDIGSLTPKGFLLHGRASAAEIRGCSLSVEEILEPNL